MITFLFLCSVYDDNVVMTMIEVPDNKVRKTGPDKRKMEEQYIQLHYTGKHIWAITEREFLRLKTGECLNESLIMVALQRQLPPWVGMSRVNLVNYIFQANPTRPLGDMLEALKAEVVFILHHYHPNHWGAVIVIRDKNTLHMLMADGLQMQDKQLLDTYANYFHYLESYSTGQQFELNTSYSSQLEIRKHETSVQQQSNRTDCGLHVVAYHQCTHEWYGVTAGVTEGQERIDALIRELGNITAEKVSALRVTLRENMHEWTDGWWKTQVPQVPAGRRGQMDEVVVVVS